jgi:hypothetical protein
VTRRAALTPLAKLREHPDNPRTIKPAKLEQLKATLTQSRDLLEARPLIALPDGTVIAGNMRLRAARELGWDRIPVITFDLDEATARQWMLLDNNPFGDWDESVAAMVAGLDAELRGFTGFDTAELDRLISQAQQQRPDADDVPPAPAAKPRSRRGELYELGPHRLFCGDSTDADDVAALFAGERAALAFTSPPYLDLRLYGGGLDLDPERLAGFLPTWAGHADLIAVNLGLIVRDGEIVRHWDVYLDAARGAGLKLIAWNVWNREDATSMGAQKLTFPLWHEWVFVFGAATREPNRVIPTKNAGRTTARGQRLQDGTMAPPRVYPVAGFKALGSVLTTPSHKGPSAGDHPAVFPVALPTAYIRAVTGRGDVVADPFGGSGTTLIAADELGRRAFLMELDPRYCDVIRDRWAAWTAAP